MKCHHLILTLPILFLTACGVTDDINRLEKRADLYYEIGRVMPFTGDIDSEYANSSIYGKSYNGVVRIRGTFVDGKKEGIWYEWYSRGKPFFAGEYINGLPEGLHNWWHPNGKMLAEGPYVHGKRHGVYKSWYESGARQLLLNYEADNLHGEQLRWDPNGMLSMRVVYDHGKLRCRQLYDGNQKVYEETGRCHSLE